MITELCRFFKYIIELTAFMNDTREMEPALEFETRPYF